MHCVSCCAEQTVRSLACPAGGASTQQRQRRRQRIASALSPGDRCHARDGASLLARLTSASAVSSPSTPATEMPSSCGADRQKRRRQAALHMSCRCCTRTAAAAAVRVGGVCARCCCAVTGIWHATVCTRLAHIGLVRARFAAAGAQPAGSMRVRSSLCWRRASSSALFFRRRRCAQAGLQQRLLAVCRGMRGDQARQRGVLLLQQAAPRLRFTRHLQRSRRLRLQAAQARRAGTHVGVHTLLGLSQRRKRRLCGVRRAGRCSKQRKMHGRCCRRGWIVAGAGHRVRRRVAERCLRRSVQRLVCTRARAASTAASQGSNVGGSTAALRRCTAGEPHAARDGPARAARVRRGAALETLGYKWVPTERPAAQGKPTSDTGAGQPRPKRARHARGTRQAAVQQRGLGTPPHERWRPPAAGVAAPALALRRHSPTRGARSRACSAPVLLSALARPNAWRTPAGASACCGRPLLRLEVGPPSLPQVRATPLLSQPPSLRVTAALVRARVPDARHAAQSAPARSRVGIRKSRVHGSFGVRCAVCRRRQTAQLLLARCSRRCAHRSVQAQRHTSN
jgi:hypothetical protein